MRLAIGLIIIICFITSGCSPIMGIYGVKTPKELNEKKIERSAKKYDIPLTDVFELDTACHPYLFTHDTIKYKSQIKNHYQPLQALYYSQSGQLKSFQVNCYAGGFPNITWERDSILTVFPPKIQAPIDSLISLTTQIKYLNGLSFSNEIKLANYDYIIFVYWSKFMGRQSKRFVSFVKKNRLLAEDKRIRIIYVNNDNLFAKSGIW